MKCGQGKPYMILSNNEKMASAPTKARKEYKSGGLVYTDKNDEDTKLTHKEMQILEEGKKNA